MGELERLLDEEMASEWSGGGRGMPGVYGGERRGKYHKPLEFGAG